MKTIKMNRLQFEIPEKMEWHREQEAFVASMPGSKNLVLRISVNTVLKDGVPVPGAGVRSISGLAAKERLDLSEEGDKVWFRTMKDASEGTRGSVMHYWFVGFDAHGLVVSCFVDGACLGSAEAEQLLEAASHVVESLKSSE